MTLCALITNHAKAKDMTVTNTVIEKVACSLEYFLVYTLIARR